jgi:hypothetical protein
VQELGRIVHQRQNACALCYCLLLPCASIFCLQTAGDVVGKVVQELGRLDILVNNASVQHMATSLEDITPEQLQETFAINVFGYFFMAQVQGVVLGREVWMCCCLAFVPFCCMFECGLGIAALSASYCLQGWRLVLNFHVGVFAVCEHVFIDVLCPMSLRNFGVEGTITPTVTLLQH